MSDRDVLIIRGHEVSALLEGREEQIMDTVRRAYIAHAKSESALPHSTFLRFPGDTSNRIIALPAYLGDGFDTAGVKWVASFPGNVAHGLSRASAVVVLNSMDTGRPQVILEGSHINAKRTAASAVLGAQSLHQQPVEQVGVIGCGIINFEIVRFLIVAFPSLKRISVFDLDSQRAEQFASSCRAGLSDIELQAASDLTTLFRDSPLVSLATTAIVPHISDLSASPPGATLLHVSLRDLSPEIMLESINVVDDVDHVCRASTSIHLTEQAVGHRDFIAGTLADVLLGDLALARDRKERVVFSPFGLGVLDVAVGKLIYELAQEQGAGTTIESFIPKDEPAGLKSPRARRVASV